MEDESTVHTSFDYYKFPSHRAGLTWECRAGGGNILNWKCFSVLIYTGLNHFNTQK